MTSRNFRVGMTRRTALAIGVAASVLFVMAACASPKAATAVTGASATVQSSTATQTSDGGQVTVAVTWQGPSAGPVFTIAMNTHAVNLDGYDLKQLAVLRTDQGQEVKPIGWDAPKGGHHREGRLTFPSTTNDGAPLIGPQTRSLELVIRNVAGVPERTFTWKLSS